MSDPIPLTKPDGTVHAYLCGVCQRIGGGGHAVIGLDGKVAVLPAEYSLRDASTCCVCRTCNAPAPHELECPTCKEAWRAKREAETAARAALAETSVPGEGAEHYTLRLGEVAVDVELHDRDWPGFYTAVARYRSADAPGQNQDWTQPLQRHGLGAVLHVAEEASYAIDSETVTLVPRGSVVLSPTEASEFAGMLDLALDLLEKRSHDPKSVAGCVLGLDDRRRHLRGLPPETPADEPSTPSAGG